MLHTLLAPSPAACSRAASRGLLVLDYLSVFARLLFHPSLRYYALKKPSHTFIIQEHLQILLAAARQPDGRLLYAMANPTATSSSMSTTANRSLMATTGYSPSTDSVTLTERSWEPTSLPPTDPWYTFDMAVNDAFPSDANRTSPTLSLWENGCFDGYSTWNCTLACQDAGLGPQALWNSPNSTYTMQNCMVLPSILTAASEGLLYDPAHLLRKYNINGTAQNWTMSNASALDVWPVIAGCISTYCTDVHDSAVCGLSAQMSYSADAFSVSARRYWRSTVPLTCLRGVGQQFRGSLQRFESAIEL